MRRTQRNFYRESANSLLSDIKIDGALRVLDRVRHRPGWTLLLMVRLLVVAALAGGVGLPRRVGPAGAAAIDASLRALLRKGDLLVPLSGSSFLIIAQSMDDQPLAFWVRDRLIAQVQGLSVEPPMRIHHRLLVQPQADIRQLFAGMAEMHLDAAAARRPPAPAPAGMPLAAAELSDPAESLDPRDCGALGRV